MEAFPQPPPPAAALELSWEYIKEGIHQIMGDCTSDEPAPPMNYSYYMALYAATYNFCTSSRLPPGDVSTIIEAPEEILGGAFLYKNLTTYFEDYVHRLASVIPSSPLEDLSILTLYSKIWSNYTSRLNQLNRLFTYLNRNWVRQYNAQNEDTLLQVYSLGLKAFKEIYLGRIQSAPEHRLTDALLKVIIPEDQPTTTVVQNIIASFVALGDESHGEPDAAPGTDEEYAKSFVEATKGVWKTEEEGMAVRRCLRRKEY